VTKTQIKVDVLKALRNKINERRDDECWDSNPGPPITWGSLSNVITDTISDIIVDDCDDRS